MSRSSTPTPGKVDPDSPLALVCSACRAGPFSYEGFREAISTSDYHRIDGYSYTTTWAQISESISKEACNWCKIVRRARAGLPPIAFLDVAGEGDARVRFQLSTGVFYPVKNLEIYLGSYMAATYTIYAEPGDSAVDELGPEATLFQRKLYLDYPRTLECIKECGDHEHCPAIDETYLPTRVIDCSDPSKPRLVKTHRKIWGYYCALSYVWGGEQHQKTTLSNIDAYLRDGINIPLPQTIADAILVTKKLGIRYLWVDALCIIQDSSEDKVKEMRMMAQIYRDAYVTICVEAYRADQGFLPDERAPDVLPFRPADRSISSGRMLLVYDIEKGPQHLQTRGWSFQESLLSPRRLTFRPPGATYECRSFGQRELGRYSSDQPAPPANNSILFPINKNRASTSTAGEVGDEELQERWRCILKEYSSRRITVPSDKLPALAGIAEIFQTLRKDQYIAGLWRRSLLDDLLWEVRTGPFGRPLSRPSDYRAPTWSWASVEGALNFSNVYRPPLSTVSYEAEIVAWEVILKDSTLPFGEVTNGGLRMRVKMHSLMRDGRKCAFRERRGAIEADGSVTAWSWTPPAGNCLEPGVFSIGVMEERNIGAYLELLSIDPANPIDALERAGKPLIGDIAFDCLEGTDQDYQEDFYVIILRAGRRRETWAQPRKSFMEGLIVLRVGDDEDYYRRVAKVNLNRDFQWLDWFDATPLKTVTLI